MNGKEKCLYLKELRNKMAKENGIEYHTDECKFKGDCKGTCPKCEAELKELTRKINEKRRRKYLVGVSVGVAALGLVGCTDTSTSDVGLVGPSVENHSTEESQLEGDLAVDLTESNECNIENTTEDDRHFSGDVVYVGDLDDTDDETTTEEETTSGNLIGNQGMDDYQLEGGLSLDEYHNQKSTRDKDQSTEISSLEQLEPEPGEAISEEEEVIEESSSIPMDDLLIPTAGVLPPRK